ncbi:MAG: dihydropteroate synthase, partial [Hyphomicrobium sp.]
MQRTTYVRPLGLFPAPADAAEEAWSGLPLAGQALRFTTVEVATREGTRIGRRIVALDDAIERDWG